MNLPSTAALSKWGTSSLLTKVRIVKGMVFPVVMYGRERWTIKKAERQRIDAFEMWCWRRLLRVPWTARRSNQSTLKEINPEYSLEGLMLKLKLQYFGHLMQRANSLKKILMLGKTESREEGDDRGQDGWITSPIQWTWVWVNSGSWWRTGKPGVLQSMGSQRVGHDWATQQLNNNLHLHCNSMPPLTDLLHHLLRQTPNPLRRPRPLRDHLLTMDTEHTLGWSFEISVPWALPRYI